MSKLLPGEIRDAVVLAVDEVKGERLLTYRQYRQVAQALVQVEAELTELKRSFCPERSQPHVTRGDDPQCTVCYAYLPKR